MNSMIIVMSFFILVIVYILYVLSCEQCNKQCDTVKQLKDVKQTPAPIYNFGKNYKALLSLPNILPSEAELMQSTYSSPMSLLLLYLNSLSYDLNLWTDARYRDATPYRQSAAAFLATDVEARAYLQTKLQFTGVNAPSSVVIEKLLLYTCNTYSPGTSVIPVWWTYYGGFILKYTVGATTVTIMILKGTTKSYLCEWQEDGVLALGLVPAVITSVVYPVVAPVAISVASIAGASSTANTLLTCPYSDVSSYFTYDQWIKDKCTYWQGGVYVHRGFNRMYNYRNAEWNIPNLRQQINSYLSANLNTINRLYVSGHSLGGGLAKLCIADITANFNSLKRKTRVYSYAGPYSGNQAFVNMLMDPSNIITSSPENSGIYDIINVNDPVPTLGLPGYARIPSRFKFGDPGVWDGLNTEILYVHSLECYEKGVRENWLKWDVLATSTLPNIESSITYMPKLLIVGVYNNTANIVYSGAFNGTTNCNWITLKGSITQKNITKLSDCPVRTYSGGDTSFLFSLNVYLPLQTNANDYGTMKQSVTTNGSVTYTTIAGKNCAYFNNNMSNYLSLNYPQSSFISICFWFYPIDANSYTMVSITDSLFNPVLQFDISATINTVYTSAPNQWTISPSGTNSGITKWNHIAITFNQANYEETLYINGVSVSVVKGTGPLPTRGNKFFIGRSGDNGRAFNGYISDFIFSNTLLSDTQINQIYTSTSVSRNDNCIGNTYGQTGWIPAACPVGSTTNPTGECIIPSYPRPISACAAGTTSRVGYNDQTSSCIAAVENTGFVPKITWGSTPVANQQAICDDLLCQYFVNKYGDYNSVPSTYSAEKSYCVSKYPSLTKQLPEDCYVPSYNRTPLDYTRTGTVPSLICPGGTLNFGTSCYQMPSFRGKGCCCTMWGCCNNCNPGERDDGACLCITDAKFVNPSGYSCPAGQTNISGLCYPACNSGLVSSGARCVPQIAPVENVIGGSYYPNCNAGYTASGVTCNPSAPVQTANSRYGNCNAGYTASGANCNPNTATIPFSTRCASGGVSVMKSNLGTTENFEKDNRGVLLQTMCYPTCLTGFTNLNNTCVPNNPVVPASSRCPSGTVYNSIGCFPSCTSGNNEITLPGSTIATSCQRILPSFKNVFYSNNKLFALDTSNNIYYSQCYYSGNFISIPAPTGSGGLVHLSFDGIENIIVGITSSGVCYYANTNIYTTPNWTSNGAPVSPRFLVNISYSNGMIAGANNDGTLIINTNYTTTNWSTPMTSLSLRQVSLDGYNRVLIALTNSGDMYYSLMNTSPYNFYRVVGSFTLPSSTTAIANITSVANMSYSNSKIVATFSDGSVYYNSNFLDTTPWVQIAPVGTMQKISFVDIDLYTRKNYNQPVSSTSDIKTINEIFNNCEADCDFDPTCIGFSREKTKSDNEQGQCVLKKSAPGVVQNDPNFVTYVKPSKTSSWPSSQSTSSTYTSRQFVAGSPSSNLGNPSQFQSASLNTCIDACESNSSCIGFNRKASALDIASDICYLKQYSTNASTIDGCNSNACNPSGCTTGYDWKTYVKPSKKDLWPSYNVRNVTPGTGGVIGSPIIGASNACEFVCNRTTGCAGFTRPITSKDSDPTQTCIMQSSSAISASTCPNPTQIKTFVKL